MHPVKILFWLSLQMGVALAARSQREVGYKDSTFKYLLSIDSSLSSDSVNQICSVKAIKIFSKKSGKLVQVIVPDKNFVSCSLQAEQLFILEDMNFDGKPDIRLVQFLPASPNVPYYFWIYDPTKGQFIRNKELEKITSPEFDPKNKLIFSFWRNGCCTHGMNTYRYISGHITLIEGTSSRSDGEGNSQRTKIVRVPKKGE